MTKDEFLKQLQQYLEMNITSIGYIGKADMERILKDLKELK